jgi:hypothetical protein
MLLGFDHHRVDFGQLGHFPPQGLAGRHGAQVLATCLTGGRAHIDDFVRRSHQELLKLGMAGFCAMLPAVFAGGWVCMLIARGRLRRVARRRGRLLSTRQLSFQALQTLSQLQDDRNEFFARQVAQAFGPLAPSYYYR